MSRVCLLSIALAVWSASELIVASLCASSFPTPYNTEPDSGGPPPATAAASQMRVPDGFQVKVFASEPDVQNPIAMAWDARGRLWIAENYTYAEAPKKFDLGLRDRIVIFEDSDGDGKFDRRTQFTEEVQMITSLEIGHGGVWAMCPPQLLYIPLSSDGNHPAGTPKVVLDGFDIPGESYHNFANGLRWGPDGWLYGRCGGTAPGNIGAPGTPAEQRIPLRGGMWRFHPQRQVFEALNCGTTNPWGHDWDKHGELFFVNTVNGHLWHSIAGAHFVRGSTIDQNPHVYALIDQHADHWHFDTNQGWSKSRDGNANALGGGHAHIGALIYQGNNWPMAFRDRLFTFNMHGLRVNQEILEPRGSGYVGRHGADFLVTDDKWFRGLDMSAGPDGAVFAIDWSDTGECHERSGIHRTSGRIFKIQYGETAPIRDLNLEPKSAAQLAALHTHENEWFVRQARRVLVDRIVAGQPVDGAHKELRNLFDAHPQNPVIQLRVLWTLHAMGRLQSEFLRAQLSHQNEHVRAWAIRFLTDAAPLDTTLSKRPHADDLKWADSICPELMLMAKSEPSALVRLVIASAMQRLPVLSRPEIAQALCSHAEDADDHNLPLMIWYGLIPVAQVQPEALVKVAVNSAIPLTRTFIARRLAEEIERAPAAFNQLLKLSLQAPNKAVLSDVLEGTAKGLAGWSKAPKPAVWDAVVEVVSEQSADAKRAIRELSVLFGDGRALEEVRRLALDSTADISARKSALRSMIESRPAESREVCERLLSVKFLNLEAARGLSQLEDPSIGEALVKAYSAFHVSERPQLIAILVSRPSFVRPLLKAMESGKIPKSVISPFEVRQILGFGDPELSGRLASVWGELRESGADKKQLIASMKLELQEALSHADLSQGRVVFNAVCSACHALYGEGGKIGPDLTGAGRDNLDYLLENILDPSAVVSADFRMAILHTKDGRIFNGMIRDKTEKTLSVQTMVDRVTLERAMIDRTEELPVSLMPEGLLGALSAEQRRDLIGYLMKKTQVPLP